MTLIGRRKGDPVYQRVKGGRYCFDVRAWRPVLRADEPKHHWLLSATDRATAVVEAAKTIKELSERAPGKRVVKSASRHTIDDLIPAFLADLQARSVKRRADRTAKRVAFLRDIALFRFQNFAIRGVRMGDLPVQAIETQHVKKFLRRLSDDAPPPTAFGELPASQRKKHASRGAHQKGLSASSIRHHQFSVRALLAYACEEGLIATNPVDGLQRNSGGDDAPSAGRALKGWELALLLHAAAQHRTRYQQRFAPILHTMAYTGCRLSEVAGLLVGDVHVERREVHVTANKWRGVKSKKGGRYVPMPPALVTVLAEAVAQRRAEGAADTDLLWPNRLGRPRSWTKAYRAVCELAGIGKVGNHDLRRSYCSHALLLTMNGAQIPATVVAKWAGHSATELTTDLYAKSLDGDWNPNRGEWLDFSVERYRGMPGFSEKLAACDTCDMAVAA
jgi:integrase